MQGQDVVTSDDHKLGTVVAEQDGCVIVESGHVFKTRHAIPTEFLHEFDGVLRATVGKEIVEDSPKVDGESFDENAVKLHYGLIEISVVDPDPEEPTVETDPTTSSATPSGLDAADAATLGGHPRAALNRPAGDTKPGEPQR